MDQGKEGEVIGGLRFRVWSSEFGVELHCQSERKLIRELAYSVIRKSVNSLIHQLEKSGC